MERRIFGIENEYGVTCTFEGQRRLTPDEVARYLFRQVVSWGRSSNVFLSQRRPALPRRRLHPEYATPECDDVRQLVVHDKAGERILEGLVADAQQRLADEGIAGEVYLFKNNTDSAGNSYGCHENYLVGRRGRVPAALRRAHPVPGQPPDHLRRRQGRCTTPRGATYCVSQRADHIWEGVSSATTRSRPIINTRDEPHADAEKYRRLHVIVGDSNMSETTTMLKVGSADLVLRMIESGAVMRDLTLENPIRAIREISHDITGRRTVKLANGRELSRPGDPARVLRAGARLRRPRGPDDAGAQERARPVAAHPDARSSSGDLAQVDTEIDWVIKHRLIERYRAKHDLALSSPRIAQIDLAYHDIHRRRGLYYLLQRHGQIDPVTSDLEIFEAKSVPPQTTRAKLRGDFVRRAQEHRRDFTVDWVHLKLNDQAQRTVLCKDPFAAVDDAGGAAHRRACDARRTVCRAAVPADQQSPRVAVMAGADPPYPRRKGCPRASVPLPSSVRRRPPLLLLGGRLRLRAAARTPPAPQRAPRAAAPWTRSRSPARPGKGSRPSRSKTKPFTVKQHRRQGRSRQGTGAAVAKGQIGQRRLPPASTAKDGKEKDSTSGKKSAPFTADPAQAAARAGHRPDRREGRQPGARRHAAGRRVRHGRATRSSGCTRTTPCSSCSTSSRPRRR